MAALPLTDPRMLAVALAALTAAVPGGFALMRADTPDVSYEKRMPSVWPADSVYENPQGYQRFFEDRLGWRREFIVLRNRISAAIGISPTPLSRMGEGNWLFNARNKVLVNRAGLLHFDDATVRRWQSEFKRRTEFWAQRGIRYYFLLGPDKSSIYPERLGSSFPIGETLFDRIRRRHGDDVFGTNFIDPRDILRQNKTPTTYYAIDSHWNVLGAQLAHDVLLRRMSRDFPQLQPIARLSDIRWRPASLADLVPTGLEARYPDQEPYFADADDKCVPRTIPIDEHWPSYLGKPSHPGHAVCPGRPLRVLIVHDSFGLAMQGFLGRSFGKSVYFPHPIGGEVLGEAVERAAAIMGGVDVIIQERVEGAFFLNGRLD